MIRMELKNRNLLTALIVQLCPIRLFLFIVFGTEEQKFVDRTDSTILPNTFIFVYCFGTVEQKFVDRTELRLFNILDYSLNIFWSNAPWLLHGSGTSPRY